MSVTVVGSIAFDGVKTPFGEREKMLGGAAVHFALAASFFDEVRPIGPVGDDFGETELAVLRARNVVTDDIEHVPGGKTFFWKGVYGWDLNDRETLATDLNVFETFSAEAVHAAKQAEVLFLANIQPDLQRQVRAQCPGARFVALDSMNLWIEIAKDSLVAAIREVDCLMLNDAELRQLTGAPNLIRAAREILNWGPKVSSPSRASTGGADHPRRLLRAAGVPARGRDRPDRRRRHVRGRVRRVHRGQAPASTKLDQTLLRRAMAYGTALASFNVEEFGTERVARLTGAEIAGRVAELAAITRSKTRRIEPSLLSVAARVRTVREKSCCGR